ncbi:MAG: SDR family oxidoreductase [Hyphomicrobiaceae bacterium]
MSHLLAVGLGYSAERVAAALAGQGWIVTGSCRRPEGMARIRALGHRAIAFDGSAPAAGMRAAIAEATHLLVSAAPGDTGDPLLRRHGDDIRSASRLRWIGYLSTVGVYGDHQGAWVDEATPPTPVSERGQRRVEAERRWLELIRLPDRTVQVFRLAGIYGPGRNQLEQLRRGEAKRIVKPGQVFNRIHVDDIAGAVLAGIQHAEASGIFNVADDLPAPPDKVVAYAAGLLGCPAPPAEPFETAALSPMARSFYGEVKRVSNSRLKRELGWQPRYPTYREGLAALVET